MSSQHKDELKQAANVSLSAALQLAGVSLVEEGENGGDETAYLGFQGTEIRIALYSSRRNGEVNCKFSAKNASFANIESPDWVYYSTILVDSGICQIDELLKSREPLDEIFGIAGGVNWIYGEIHNHLPQMIAYIRNIQK